MTLASQLGFAVVNGLVFGSLLALTAVGLSLTFGVLGVPNFAQGEFAALAGFVTAGLVNLGLGLLPSAGLGLLAAFVAGVAVERLVVANFYDREEFLLYAFFATFGLTVISESALRHVFGGYRRISVADPGSVGVLGVEVSLLRLGASAIAVGTLAALYLFTHRTYAGLAVRAVADDRRGAALVGIDHERVYALTFGLGAALTGATGILYGTLFTLQPAVGVRLTAFAFAIVVVGGVGSFGGTVVASLLIGLVDSLTASFVGGQWRYFAVFAVLFAFLTLRPGGLAGDSRGGE